MHSMSHWKADHKGSMAVGGLGLGNLLLRNVPESMDEIQPLTDEEAGLSITADARIDNRTYLTQQFGLSKQETSRWPDCRFIVEAYKKWYTGCVSYLEGDFAFAIWDSVRHELFCARDIFGIKPFHYYHEDGLFAFATEMKGILSLTSVDQTLAESWIADFMLNIRPDRHVTFYEHIVKLPAAHFLHFKEGHVKTHKYWSVDTKTVTHLSSEQEYVDTFLELLNQAVEKRLRSNWLVTSELSGGLDSSAVASIAQKIQSAKGQRFASLSDVMPDPIPWDDPTLEDDRKQILEVAKFSGIKETYFVTGEEKTFLQTLKRALDFHDEPPIKFVNVFADLLYEKAESLGSRTLLSGFGGDDVVSYAGHYFHEELLRTGQWRTLWKESQARSKHLGDSHFKRLINTFSYAVLEPKGVRVKALKWKHFQRDSWKVYQQKFERSGLRPELIEKHDLINRFHQKRIYDYRGKNMNEKIADRLEHPRMFPHRLEYCNISAAHCKLEIRYPLLDRPLVDFFMSIPSTQKIKNGWGRYFFRRATEGILPDQVRWQFINTGSASPSGIWRKYRDRDAAVKALEEISPQSRVHQYIDIPAYLAKTKELASKKQLENYGAIRVLMLDKKLNQLFGEPDHSAL